ncbi:hypothetical protein [Pseudomonas sp. NPDC007930]|uniref:hypothetical protein n=1 Tax=Pseudomonas sp. NPDC007930 TaxID=3364417 RepID=UPI0036E49BD4
MQNPNEGYDEHAAALLPTLQYLMNNETALAGLTPETLFINGIDPHSGVVIDSNTLLHATVICVIERNPPEHGPQHEHAGVFTVAHSFQDEHRVDASFTTQDFWHMVQQAYDTVPA